MLFALACLPVLTGCRAVGKGAPEWIGPDAAVVRCTVSGPNLTLPQLFVEVPSPEPPTGLYARVMDPIALDELGFERDRAVCATLQAPEAELLDETEAAIAKLVTTRNETFKKVRKYGRCLCNYAATLDARALVPGCSDRPVQRRCEPEGETLAELEQLLEPLRTAIGETYVPRVHWRLAGRTDRVGRFVARYDELFARHPGGSEVYLPTTPLPPHPGMALVSGLLAEEHVVAVVRQDSGRAVLVVREIDDQLVLDHFAYPDWLEAGIRGVDIELSLLLHHLDDAQLQRYRAALEPPEEPRELMFDPRDGYLVELDHAALERVDRGMLLATHFAGHRYDLEKERRVVPELLTDRFAHQVPYGTEGEVLRARLSLTQTGQEWLAIVGGQSAVESLSALGGAELMPEFEPATRDGIDQLFMLRGRPVEHSLFAGPSALPQVLFAVELAATGSVTGGVDSFQVALPSGPLPGEFQTRPELGGLRERLSKQAHELKVEQLEGGSVLALELAPR